MWACTARNSLHKNQEKEEILRSAHKMVPEQVQHEYSVTDEFQEVSSSADPLLLQLIVYLVDVQDCQHEYPVREEVREVSYSADPLLPTANSIPDGQPGWPA